MLGFTQLDPRGVDNLIKIVRAKPAIPNGFGIRANRISVSRHSWIGALPRSFIRNG
jgi:hypothetical protein